MTTRRKNSKLQTPNFKETSKLKLQRRNSLRSPAFSSKGRKGDDRAGLVGIFILLVAMTSIAAPVITNQPANQVARVGDTAWFAVGASGTGTLSYQWRSNGVNISGATTTSYTTPTVAGGMNGALYSVVVTDSGGSTTTSNAMLRAMPELARAMVWNDEFNGATIDSTKWQQLGDVSRQQGFWWKTNSYLSGNGQLVLRVTKSGNNYGSGAVQTATKFSKTFGYFEAKMKFQKQQGHWDAFWIYDDNEGQNPPAGGADGAEIDIFEHPWLIDQGQNTLHWDGYGAGSGSAGKVVTGMNVNDGGWHVVGLEWTPTNYYFYLDGILTWSTNAGGVCQVPNYILCTEEVGNFGTGPTAWGTGPISNAILPDFTYFEYVRVYETNLSGSPLITTQPQSQTVNPGSSATFSVTATGTAPLSYQWLFEGGIISGATGNSYTRANVQSADSAHYSVMVTNAAGCAASAAGFLTVTPSGISMEAESMALSNYTAEANASASGGYEIKCASGATGTARYFFSGATATYNITVYYYDESDGACPMSLYVGGVLVDSWTANANTSGSANADATTRTNRVKTGVSISNGAEIKLVGTQNSQEWARFDNIVITNASGGTPPSITAQPQSQIVNQGSSVTFSATATGTAPLSYQWRFNAASISGATTSSYTKSNVQSPDAGNYSVVVTNAFGSVTSSNAVLTVTTTNVPPSITAQPQSQTVNQGGSVTFSVTATGTAPLSYQWRFNAANISGATASSYTKSNVQSPDAGSYSVVVTNIAGSVTSSNAVLTVNVPPSITTQPQSQTVNQGNSVTFSVVASGTTPLTYQWRLNAVNISGATTSSYTDSNAQPADAGNYSVVVTNVAGSVTSSNAVLTVNNSGVPTTVFDFNSGLPSGTIARGNNPSVGVTNAGGYTNSGCLILTRPTATQTYGQWLVTNDLASGTPVSSFGASFKLYIGHGSGGNAPVPNPGGNGLVFHVGPAPADQVTGSASSWGNGLDVTFRTYNSAPNTYGINIEYNAATNTKSPGSGTIIATSSYFGFFQTNGASDNFSRAVDVTVTLSNAMLSVTVTPTNGVATNVYTNLLIPGFAPISPGTIAFTASEGAGAHEDGWIDNVRVAMNNGGARPQAAVAPLQFEAPTLSKGRLTLTWSGGGVLQSSPDLIGPWADMVGAASPYSVVIDPNTPRQFYRVKLQK